MTIEQRYYQMVREVEAVLSRQRLPSSMKGKSTITYTKISDGSEALVDATLEVRDKANTCRVFKLQFKKADGGNVIFEAFAQGVDPEILQSGPLESFTPQLIEETIRGFVDWAVRVESET